MTTLVKPDEPAVLSLLEAARILRIGRSTAYELAKLGEFPIRVLKIGKQWRVTRADLERFLAGE